jgi:chromosome segregation ATPase
VSANRFLPIANLIGCVILIGMLLTQWLKERGLSQKINDLNRQLVISRDESAAEKMRANALENDVAQLKESIESTVKARQETEATMAKLIAEREAQALAIGGNQQANQEQLKKWEAAIAERDGKLRELNTNLTATRERLDEAIKKLKAAGAR